MAAAIQALQMFYQIPARSARQVSRMMSCVTNLLIRIHQTAPALYKKTLQLCKAGLWDDVILLSSCLHAA